MHRILLLLGMLFILSVMAVAGFASDHPLQIQNFLYGAVGASGMLILNWITDLLNTHSP